MRLSLRSSLFAQYALTAHTLEWISLPKLPGFASGPQIILLRQWLKHCNQNHNCSSSNSCLPTRVIDVGSGGTPSTTPIRLYSRSSSEEQGRYVALSHRWLSDPEGLRRHSHLLGDTYLAMHKNIDFDGLPKTFQDAITVTRELKIQYIWIDSLCIIQDDVDDWNREASRMEDVFSSAYLTIAATSATDGFIRPRRPRELVTVQDEREGRYYVCEFIDNLQGDIEEGPLNQRGWVLQERALSHRTLHFTSNQVYWECGHGIRTETLSKSLG